VKVHDIHAPTPQGPAARDQQAFLIGVDFHEAAMRSAVTVRDPEGAPVQALCPMIVSYAFAAELYLKSMAGIGRAMTPAKTHKLKVLFGRLCPDLQTSITQRYTARTGRTPQELHWDLAAFSDAFADWRYVFEGQGQQVRVNILVAFVKALYEEARARQLGWSVRSDQHQRLLADADEPIMTLKNLGGGTFLSSVDGTGGLLNTPEAR
jgi:hypothetical protein